MSSQAARRQTAQGQRRFVQLSLLVLIVAVLSLLAILSILGRQEAGVQSMFLSRAPIAIEIEGRALIMRDEREALAPRTGIFRSFVPAGTKLAKGALIGQIIPPDKEGELRKLKKVENDISERRLQLLELETKGFARRIFEYSDEQLRHKLHLLYQARAQGDNMKTAEIDADMKLILEQRAEDLRHYPFEDEELKQLLSYQKSLEEAVSHYIKEVRSERSGLFIRSIDHFHLQRMPDDAMDLQPVELDRLLKQTKAGVLAVHPEVEAEQPFYKIANALDHYFALFVDPSYESIIRAGDRLRMECPDNGAIMTHCKILRAEPARKQLMLVIHSTDALEAFADMRSCRLKLFVNEQYGLRVPRGALMDFEAGKEEAQIRLIDRGMIQSCPVKVLGYNASYAIIGPVDDSPYPIAEASLIVLNPHEVEDGDDLAH